MESIVFLLPVLFVLGAFAGSVTNWFVDRFCWTPRFRSPWRIWPNEFLEKLNAVKPAGISATERKKRPSKANGKTVNAWNPFSKNAVDFIPVFGWFSLARIGDRLEALPETERLPGLEKRGFWIRPCLVELFAAFGAVALYLWEVEFQMILPQGLNPEPSQIVFVRFGVHFVFFLLLLAAALIDLDDMIIPDVLTVPGTLLALILATTLPSTLLPATQTRTELVFAPQKENENIARNFDVKFSVEPKAVPLNVFSPNTGRREPEPQVPAHVASHEPVPLVHWAALSALWAFWCFAMLPRVWYSKLPFRKAAAIFCRYLRRSVSTYWLAVAAILGFIVFSLLLRSKEFFLSANHLGLLSALVGMAVGMFVIWGVRLVGSAALGREAMGFGDVTLMGMVGAFLGWQSCILIFFLAPFFGLLLILVGALNPNKEVGREFPYGPSLCLAAAVLVVAWRWIWERAAPIYELGWLVGVVMLCCFVLLGILLALWVRIRSKIFSA